MRNIFARSKTKTIKIKDCVHFAGFYYGGGTINPYEDYLQHLKKSGSTYARRVFIKFLKHYRPMNFTRALGYSFDRSIPLWCFPWTRNSKSIIKNKEFGWHFSLAEIPDIITYFNHEGILSFRIIEEFAWLERAYFNIAKNGYKPKQYGFCTAWELVNLDGSKKYILTDGNHRVSALSTLGFDEVSVKISMTIKLSNIDKWFLVRNKLMTAEVAREIFLAYFENQNSYSNSIESAKILDYNGQEIDFNLMVIPDVIDNKENH